MLSDFQTSFTVGLDNKFSAKYLMYVPRHVKYVATVLRCEIQNIENSKTFDIFTTITSAYLLNVHKIKKVNVSMCVLLVNINA